MKLLTYTFMQSQTRYVTKCGWRRAEAKRPKVNIPVRSSREEDFLYKKTARSAQGSEATALGQQACTLDNWKLYIQTNKQTKINQTILTTPHEWK